MPVYAELVAQQAVDAFVLSDAVDDDPRHDWLAERAIPFTSFGRTWPESGTQPGTWVDVDGAAACADLVAGLAALGHKRIGFVGWRGGAGAAEDRRRGWRTECELRGLPAHDDYVVRAEADTMAAGARAAAELLGRTRPPTAIVAVSDVLAVGVCVSSPSSGCDRARTSRSPASTTRSSPPPSCPASPRSAADPGDRRDPGPLAGPDRRRRRACSCVAGSSAAPAPRCRWAGLREGA